MSEVMDVVNAFGTPLKLAWVAWVAWGIGQYFWFRHERSGVVARKPKPAAAPKAAVKKPMRPAAQAAEAPVVGRLITPTHVTADVKATTHVEPPVVPEPASVAPVVAEPPASTFDPSQAVIETFGVTQDLPLDKFVRDFEMQDARPRRRRTVPAETPSYGVEAPHAH
jgi:hypothetical protein